MIKSTNMLISEKHINPAIDDKVLNSPYSFSGNFSECKFQKVKLDTHKHKES